MSYPERADEREAMVREQIEARGIRDQRVLEALRRVPRHRFALPGTDTQRAAYTDNAHSIGEEQTISQPFIVAQMTESLALTGAERALEIGAGSGYQTAILAELCREVIAIERHASLAGRAGRVLAELGYTNAHLFVGDGSLGWPDSAPYDAILCAAVAPRVPTAFLAQLAPGGRLVLPVGPERGTQHLKVFTKDAAGAIRERNMGGVAFVPLIGAAGFGLPEDLGGMDI